MLTGGLLSGIFFQDRVWRSTAAAATAGGAKRSALAATNKSFMATMH